VTSFIEVALRKPADELVKMLNAHLESRMFLVGHAITAADIALLAHTIQYFVRIGLNDKII